MQHLHHTKAWRSVTWGQPCRHDSSSTQQTNKHTDARSGGVPQGCWPSVAIAAACYDGQPPKGTAPQSGVAYAQHGAEAAGRPRPRWQPRCPPAPPGSRPPPARTASAPAPRTPRGCPPGAHSRPTPLETMLGWPSCGGTRRHSKRHTAQVGRAGEGLEGTPVNVRQPATPALQRAPCQPDSAASRTPRSLTPRDPTRETHPSTPRTCDCRNAGHCSGASMNLVRHASGSRRLIMSASRSAVAYPTSSAAPATKKFAMGAADTRQERKHAVTAAA